MFRRLRNWLVIWSCFSLLALGFDRPAQELGVWEQVSVGIDYQEFSLPGPVYAYVARMDRSNQQVTLDSSLALGKVSGGMETVTNMARRYNQSITYWDSTWGSRMRVVIAVNGSFVVPSTGAPQNGMVQSGWYIKRYDDLGGGTGFAWNMDRSAFIGGCAYHRPEKQLIQFANGSEMTFNGINIPREGSQTILYTPQYDTNTRTGPNGVEVLVEMSKPLMILPTPSYASGVVRDIRDGAGSTFLPFDHLVISAGGSAGESLLANVQIGDEVRFSQEITSFESNCSTPNPNSWAKTYASIGGSFVYLKDRDIQDFTDDGALKRHPRTAIAYNDEYIFFIVVDGRDDDYSIGMTMDELGRFSRDVLGARWGVNQDGGGSSTMVVNGVVKNRPSVPCYPVYLPLISQSGPLKPNGARGREKVRSQETLPQFVCERNVANGMMMVVVEEMNQSSTFLAGTQVSLRGDGRLRLGPGTNYEPFAELPTHTHAVLVEHPLQGVFAKGYYWWKVAVGNIAGWVPEQSLLFITPSELRSDQYRQP